MRFRPNRLAVTLALAVLCAGAIAAPTAGQQLPGQDGNETDAPGETQVAEQLGDLVVHSYDYEDGTMSISATWQGETPETVTLTEMVELDSAGATQISFKTVRLMPGDKTEITIAVEKVDGTAAVLLNTPQSVEANNALVLQAGDGADRGPVPFGWASILIGLSALGGAGLAFAFTARDQSDDADAQRRERIA